MPHPLNRLTGHRMLLFVAFCCLAFATAGAFDAFGEAVNVAGWALLGFSLWLLALVL